MFSPQSNQWNMLHIDKMTNWPWACLNFEYSVTYCILYLYTLLLCNMLDPIMQYINIDCNKKKHPAGLYIFITDVKRKTLSNSNMSVRTGMPNNLWKKKILNSTQQKNISIKKGKWWIMICTESPNMLSNFKLTHLS